MKNERRRVRDIINEESARDLARGLGYSTQYIYALKDGSRPVTGGVVMRARAWLGETVDIDLELAELDDGGR